MKKIIHQIWVGPFCIPTRERKFAEGVKAAHPDWEHRLWTNENLPAMPEKIKATYDMLGLQRDYAFQADVLRVFVVSEFGGVYLDVDMEVKRGLSILNLDNRVGFFCGHYGDDYTIPNGAFGGSPDSKVMRFLRDDISPASGWYGPSWMGDTVKKFYGMVRESPHDALVKSLAADGIDYVRWGHFDSECFRHYALYSWHIDNRTKMEAGDYDH